jgi:hypothetical protein
MALSIETRVDAGAAIGVSKLKSRSGDALFTNTRDELRRASKVLKNTRLGRGVQRKLSIYFGMVIAQNFFDQRGGPRSGFAPWPPLALSTIRRKRKLSSGFTDVMEFAKKKGGEEHQQFSDPSVKSGKGFLPLVQTGKLFRSVATPVGATRVFGGSQMRLNAGETARLVVQPERGYVTIQPGRMNGDLLQKFRIHNKPVGESTVVQVKGKGGKTNSVTVPGREFFYFQDQDVKFLKFVLIFAAFYGTGRRTDRHKANQAFRGGSYSTPKDAQGSRISRIDTRIDQLFDKGTSLTGMLDESTMRIYDQMGVPEFVRAASSISRAAKKAMAFRKKR